MRIGRLTSDIDVLPAVLNPLIYDEHGWWTILPAGAYNIVPCTIAEGSCKE